MCVCGFLLLERCFVSVVVGVCVCDCSLVARECNQDRHTHIYSQIYAFRDLREI